ncbi:MAG: RNA polymerase subunit sigma-24 [Planctomycetaceae bacterium]|nr:RNA polymerase subunit sigma-24 [Planctomycetaceae bacterium]
MSSDEVHETDVEHLIARVYERDARRIFATLVRLLGDFDLAEDALHEAFAAAVTEWPRQVPANPRAWLVSTGRFKAIDALRRRSRFDANLQRLARRIDAAPDDDREIDERQLQDDQLRLIFTCCHPALPPETQVALTLREVCGLKTEEVAAAYLTTAATIAQRIVRGKAKIRDAGIPFAVPGDDELPQRLDAVLAVVYLVFNEGYSASSGASAVRVDLSSEAIRLGRLLVQLLSDAEVQGLLALMLLHESRRTARTDAAGDLVLLEDQDRAQWDQRLIDEGRALVQQAFASGRVGAYALQAAISAVHAEAQQFAQTDWARIVSYYDLLLVATPSPVVELNRAVAVAMRDGPAAGLALVEEILERGELLGYHLAHAARADFCRRLGRVEAARAAYERALELAKQEPERRFLAKRLQELAAELP